MERDTLEPDRYEYLKGGKMSDDMIGIKPGWSYPGYLRMSDFGVTFDGKTNDYENLQHAIETARREKLLLTLPNGQAVRLW